MRILFVSDGRSCRSQMAEALAKHLSRERVEVFSAAIEPNEPHPIAIEAMGRLGVDVFDERCMTVADFKGQVFDFVITIGKAAQASYLPGLMARQSLTWAIENPCVQFQHAKERLTSFSRVAREIRHRIQLLFAVQERKRTVRPRSRTEKSSAKRSYPEQRSRNDALPWPTAFVYHGEPKIARALHFGLEVAGFRVRSVSHVQSGVSDLRASAHDLVLLALRYPCPDGMDLLRVLQPFEQGRLGVAALVTDANDFERRIAEALGVTLWMPGSAPIEEIMRRVTAYVTERGYLRSSAVRLWCPRSWGRFLLGPVLVDALERFVEVRGQRRKLTALQARLLTYLAENTDGKCEADILRDVWGISASVQQTKRVHTALGRMRNLLRAEGSMIEWVGGAGFRLAGPFAKVVPVA